MKKYKLLLFILCFTNLLIGQQQVVSTQREQAIQFYKEGKYKKAIQLFEKIIPIYRPIPLPDDTYFYYAFSFFHSKKYEKASYYLDYLIKTYPTNALIEEALYKKALSKYELLKQDLFGQSNIQETINLLHSFVQHYPQSPFVADVQLKIELLDKKINPIKTY